jgi:hypothetical protein
MPTEMKLGRHMQSFDDERLLLPVRFKQCLRLPDFTALTRRGNPDASHPTMNYLNLFLYNHFALYVDLSGGHVQRWTHTYLLLQIRVVETGQAPIPRVPISPSRRNAACRPYA